MTSGMWLSVPRWVVSETTKALCVFKIWGTIRPVTKRRVLEDLLHQLHHCENLGYRHITKNFYVTDYIIRELKMWRTCGSGHKDRDREERSIVQYHYLVWKDFMAPEHPAGILKFIRRMNEVYSLEKGPILVHCRCVHRVAVLRILMMPCGWHRHDICWEGWKKHCFDCTCCCEHNG